MMTYGWAILVIVIVAGVLYSLGIFSPTSSLSSTVTGFSNLGSVTGECTANGILRISLGDSTGYPINITSVTAKSSTGQISTFKPNSTVDPNPIIQPTSSYIFSVPNICPAAGSRYSLAVTVNYTEPGQIFSGPYTSTGTVAGTVSSIELPSDVAFFNGVDSNFHSYIPQITSVITFTFWVNFKLPEPNNCPSVLFINFTNTGWDGPDTLDSYLWGSTCNSPINEVLFALNSTGDAIANGNSGVQVNGEWHFVVFEATNSWVALYIDGSIVYNQTTSSPVEVGPASLQIGGNGRSIDYLHNLQIYPNILSQAQLNTIYLAGLSSNSVILGTAGWWPLNGTAKDYSGNGNNGVASNVIYTSNYPS
jgi:hypothetical protein